MVNQKPVSVVFKKQDRVAFTCYIAFDIAFNFSDLLAMLQSSVIS